MCNNTDNDFVSEMFKIYLSDTIKNTIHNLNHTVTEQTLNNITYNPNSIQTPRDRNSFPNSRNNTFQNRKFDKRKNNGGNNSNENWNAEKPVFKPTMSIKLTKEGIDKDLNEIRALLNKITHKTYETNRDTVLELITKITENTNNPEEYVETISQFIYDTASTNKFYGEVYADLYKELITKFQIFLDILLKFVSTYKDQIGTIKYVDSNLDYDGYCAYIKGNEKRRATANFFVLLMKRDVLQPNTIIDLIVYFQDVFQNYINEVNRVNEVDEITEDVFLLISVGKDCIASFPEWNNVIIPNVIKASKLKAKEQKSLSSRSVFKYMDLLKKVS